VSDSFTLAGLGMTAYDNNVFRLPSYENDVSAAVGRQASRKDHIESLAVGTDAQAMFGRQSAVVSLQSTKNWFSQNHDLDNTSIQGDGTLNWTVRSELTGQAGVVYTRSLADFAYTSAYIKDLIQSAEYFNSFRFIIRPEWVLFGGATYAKTDESAPELQYDDFYRVSGDVGTQYVLSSTDIIGAKYSFTSEHFPSPTFIDGLPFDRSFHESVEQILLKHQVGAFILLDASGGYLQRSYPQAVTGAFSGAIGRGSLQWNPTTKAQITATAWHELRAFVESESNYFIADGLGISARYSPTIRIQVSGKLSTERQNFVPADTALLAFLRHDRMTTRQLLASYTPRDQFSVQLSYQSTSRTSSLPINAFDDAIWMASLRIQL
jgi:hypothetical protein